MKLSVRVLESTIGVKQSVCIRIFFNCFVQSIEY